MKFGKHVAFHLCTPKTLNVNFDRSLLSRVVGMNLLTKFTPLFGLQSNLKLKINSIEQVVIGWLNILRILDSNKWCSRLLALFQILIDPNEN